MFKMLGILWSMMSELIAALHDLASVARTHTKTMRAESEKDLDNKLKDLGLTRNDLAQFDDPKVRSVSQLHEDDTKPT